MTLKEIAKEAGVAISTVSRVLNHPEQNAASPEVRERILAIANRAGYVPNESARKLQNRQPPPLRCQRVYVLIACPPGEVQGDPFFITIASSIEQEISAHRLTIADTYSFADLSNPSFLEHFPSESAGALIVIGRFDPALLKTLRKRFEHIVYVGLNRLKADCDQVLCDGYEAMQEAVRYLVELGHRRIGFLGAEPEGRYQGFLRAIHENGLDDCLDAVVQTDVLSMDGGYSGMQALIQRRPRLTAVVCANDMTAIGALQACKDAGLRVPEDVSLIGMEDIANVRFVEPKLTTIHAPLEEMGVFAARLLISRTEGRHTLPLRVMVPFHIVERESCQSPVPFDEPSPQA